MNLVKNLRKYFRRRFRVIVKKEEYFMKCFMKWSLSMILIVAMVLVVISIGFTQEKVTITVQDYFMPG